MHTDTDAPGFTDPTSTSCALPLSTQPGRSAPEASSARLSWSVTLTYSGGPGLPNVPALKRTRSNVSLMPNGCWHTVAPGFTGATGETGFTYVPWTKSVFLPAANTSSPTSTASTTAAMAIAARRLGIVPRRHERQSGDLEGDQAAEHARDRDRAEAPWQSAHGLRDDEREQRGHRQQVAALHEGGLLVEQHVEVGPVEAG